LQGAVALARGAIPKGAGRRIESDSAATYCQQRCHGQ
jgi:hypothetical protein